MKKFLVEIYYSVLARRPGALTVNLKTIIAREAWLSVPRSFSPTQFPFDFWIDFLRCLKIM